MKFSDFKGVRNCLIYSLFDHFKLGRSLVTGVLIGRRGQARARWNTLQWGQSPVASLAFGLGPLPSYSFLFFSFGSSILFFSPVSFIGFCREHACLAATWLYIYISLAPFFGCGHSTHQNSPLLFTCCCLVVPYTWNETLIACRQRSPDLHEHAVPFTASEVLYKTTCSKLVFFTLHGYIHAWGQKKKGGFYCVCSHLQC